MVIPDRTTLFVEVMALHRQGVPRWTAVRAILDKYHLRRLRIVPDNQVRIWPHPAGVQALMASHAWPKTKAGYVRALFWPYAPTFPIPAEVVDRIPPNATGDVPTRMRDVVFSPEMVYGMEAFFGLENVPAVEALISFFNGEMLMRQWRECTARRRGHLWLEFQTLTFARGPEWYCGHCLVVKLTGFCGWPATLLFDDDQPDDDEEDDDDDQSVRHSRRLCRLLDLIHGCKTAFDSWPSIEARPGGIAT